MTETQAPTFEREVISLREAANIMGMSYHQARHLVRRGAFPGAFQLTPRAWWRVSVPAIEEFLAHPRDLFAS